MFWLLFWFCPRYRADFETDVPFPAVTLCNLNQFFRSRVPDDPGLRYLIRLSSEYHTLINDSDDSTAPPPLNPVIPNPWRSPNTGTTANTSNTHSISPPPQTYVWSNITGPELSRVVWNAAHRKSEFLYLCAWNSQKIPCDEVFEERMTDLGVCFTFNGKSTRRKRRRSSTFGSWTGLRVLMIVDQDEYYFAKTMQTGVKVSFVLLTIRCKTMQTLATGWALATTNQSNPSCRWCCTSLTTNPCLLLPV